MKKVYSYTAGLVDGEGSISLISPRPGAFRRPIISIDNTDHGIIRWLKHTYGGVVVNKKVYKEHHSPAKTWRLEYDRALKFLEWIMPYMKHAKKRARAQYLLDNYKRVTLRNGRYNEEEKAVKLDFERGFFTIS